ncbi:major facilitator superfamily transporter [Xylaria bambusicola]|uniref:major facilitator superfamily transporter n=1 Tax=Xylaria bambusicola TaxID=326684 RepID=UPI0020074DCC|nr:major facilitator superfamily transporter [Xylaria bambusicola]KAI0518506.1 major facilitator superfamily transporter [Xylaria bambusicola]
MSGSSPWTPSGRLCYIFPSHTRGPDYLEKDTHGSSNTVPVPLDYAPGHLADMDSPIGNPDATNCYKIEQPEVEKASGSELASNSIHDANNNNNKIIISWENNDPENPHNWAPRRKALFVIATMMIVINSTMGSALPSMAIPYITAEWRVTSATQKGLPISTYLIGYVLGPILWGPLSEHIGRRSVTIVTFFAFTVWTLACALATSWPAFLVFRLLCGAFASAPITVTTGQIADIYDDPVPRGHALAYFMAVTVGGPLLAPIVSGFCSTTVGWRWTFWVALIYAGVTFLVVMILPETYAAVILSRRAQKIRKEDPSSQVYATAELEDRNIRLVVTRVLTRPIRMILTEPIVSATCAYLALLYAIFYISFTAFPIIFQDLYGLSAGVAGLLFLPIALGSIIALGIFFMWDNHLRKAIAENRPWVMKEEHLRVPLAILGGPVFVVSLFWLGFSAKLSVHYIIPSLSGIGFGIGFMLVFIGMLNYLTDAYEIYAASANAASSSSRSLVAVVLPLASTPLFNRLGISGACSLLAGLSLLLSAVPFIFIWKGERIRAGSKFCIELKKRKHEAQLKLAAEGRKGAENRQAIHENGNGTV